MEKENGGLEAPAQRSEDKSPRKPRPSKRRNRSRSQSRRPHEANDGNAADDRPSRRRRKDRRNRWNRRKACRIPTEESESTNATVPAAPRRKIKVPDNWIDVPKIGTLVPSSRFVAMRVPLDENYTHMIKALEHWTPSMFLSEQANQQLNVRLLIDLTNTYKYYDGEHEFKDTSIRYIKHRIEGFKRPPSDRDVDTFIEIVDQFLAREATGTIAVHCTHGLNRTGYLIVQYLVRKCGFSVRAALDAFAVARPPGLIKHLYVHELYRSLGPEEPVVLPDLPAWAAKKYAARS